MRKIIVTEFTTLDGVIEAPGGDETNHPHGGWQAKFMSPEGGKYKVDELASVDALLLGRKTYDQFSAYWPNQSGGGFADKINQMPKHIVSTTLQQVDWNNSRLHRDVAREIAALKKTEGGNMLVYGSGTLVQSLLHHDLVDELRLQLYPVSVGGGLKIFNDSRELKKFELKNARTIEGGVVLLEYLLAQ